MPDVTHAITIDGHTSMEAAPYDSTVEAAIERAVRMLESDRHFAVSLWALPPDTPIDLVKRDEWPQEYIQAAGEDGQRLTAEVRQRDESGGYEQLVIGRSDNGAPEALTEIISWSGGSSAVAPSEVLTTDEVVDLFVAYYHTATVPPAFSLRPLAAPTRQ
ncbi:MAG TPA: hypothetical protein VFH80_34835 [Solirubrobacteraceae bacterium]|nr:hypothetical protein [Solirubrobacteraceae bacterium]